MQIVSPSVRVLHSTPNAEKVIEEAGRICWKSEDRITDVSHAAFIRMLLSPDKGHESVLEHASAGFIVTTDRGISHEIVRHRLCSYSQVSTRYCNYGKDKFGGEISVIKPSELQPDTPEWREWINSCFQAETAYLEMLAKGVKPQNARSVLPTCLATEIAWTANLREWRHIWKLRGAPAAHPDIRVVIEMIKPHLRSIAPTVFEDLK
jgi:thymidylate synthase (FAD)